MRHFRGKLPFQGHSSILGQGMYPPLDVRLKGYLLTTLCHLKLSVLQIRFPVRLVSHKIRVQHKLNLVCIPTICVFLYLNSLHLEKLQLWCYGLF